MRSRSYIICLWKKKISSEFRSMKQVQQRVVYCSIESIVIVGSICHHLLFVLRWNWQDDLISIDVLLKIMKIIYILHLPGASWNVLYSYEVWWLMVSVSQWMLNRNTRKLDLSQICWVHLTSEAELNKWTKSLNFWNKISNFNLNIPSIIHLISQVEIYTK